jgi:hypothetical protein
MKKQVVYGLTAVILLPKDYRQIIILMTVPLHTFTYTRQVITSQLHIVIIYVTVKTKYFSSTFDLPQFKNLQMPTCKEALFLAVKGRVKYKFGSFNKNHTKLLRLFTVLRSANVPHRRFQTSF